MTHFTQKELGDLGFERNHVPAEVSGGAAYTYFTLNFDTDNYTNCLISGCFDEGSGKETVNVEFFEGDKSLSKEFILSLKKEFGYEKI